MIPQRITLEGFLSYGQRQEIDLSDLGLCMLSGPNGSGKSSIFDAITFALFGEHRKGKQDHDEVIHKGSDRAAVEFEFQLDGSAWKIRRTLRRATGKNRSAGHQVQLCRWRPSVVVATEPGETNLFTAVQLAGEWEVEPETSNHSGLNAWVSTHVATFAAFTCSVLLRQGEADNLLSSQPADRFKVLAGVVGLEHYQRLAALAHDRARSFEADVRSLQPQFDNTADVSEQEVRDAADKSQAAGAEVEQADREIQRLQELQLQAGQWANLRADLRRAAATLQQHSTLREKAAQIESDHRRWTELKLVLPILDRVREQRERLELLRAGGNKLAEQRAAKQADQTRLGSEIAQSADQCRATAQLIEAARQAIAELERRHSDSNVKLAAAQPYEHSARELEETRRQITAVGADPAGDLDRATHYVGALAESTAALPPLVRLVEHREKLAAAVLQLQQAKEQRGTCAAEITDAETRLAALKADAGSAETLQQIARDARARAAAEVQADENALAALHQAEGRPECPACGQALTEQHLKLEDARRRGQLQQSQERLRIAKKSCLSAETECRRAAKASADAIAARAALAERLRDLDGTMAQAVSAIARESRECRRAFDEAPEIFRRRVCPASPHGAPDNRPPDDWSATTWPAAADLAALREQAKSLPPARIAMEKAAAVYEKWKQLTAKTQALKETLSRRPADVPSDLAELRRELARVEQDRSAAAKAQVDRIDLHARQQSQGRGLADQLRNLETAIHALDREAAEQQVRLQHADESMLQAAAQLPEAWRPQAESLTEQQLKAWQREAASLEARSIEQQLAQLDLARRETHGLEMQIAAWQAEAGRLPAGARQDAAAVAALLQAARQQRQQHESARQQSQQLHHQLSETRRRRQELHQRLKNAERDKHRHSMLAELLGRDRLQMHLLRRAERAIVELAQETLDRLSGGNLTLQLRPPNLDSPGEDALSLEVIQHRTGGQPLSVDLLSGSQRFRLSVALALAIGQYTSGRRRSGECVLIDEGFGSLDLAGQEVMIRELHNLKGMLKRIILVSHQETFANAFPEGYRLRLEDGETRVERVRG